MTEATRFLPDDTYAFLGGTLAVRSNSPEVLDYIRSVYSGLCHQDGLGDAHHSDLRQGQSLVLEVVDRIDAAQELFIRDGSGRYSLRCKDRNSLETNEHSLDGFSHPFSYVEQSFLKNLSFLAKGHDFIHAASVSWNNQAILFPGASGHGKTTFSLRLLSRGFKFLSDDVTCLNRRTGMVEPFPRAARLDEQSLRLLGIPSSHGVETSSLEEGETEWLLDVGSAFPDSYSGSAELQFIVFLKGFAERTRLESVPQARALFALFKFGLRRPENVPKGLFGFAPFLPDVRCFDLVIGDLEEAVDVIRDLVTGSSRESEENRP